MNITKNLPLLSKSKEPKKFQFKSTKPKNAKRKIPLKKSCKSIEVEGDCQSLHFFIPFPRSLSPARHQITLASAKPPKCNAIEKYQSTKVQKYKSTKVQKYKSAMLEKSTLPDALLRISTLHHQCKNTQVQC